MAENVLLFENLMITYMYKHIAHSGRDPMDALTGLSGGGRSSHQECLPDQ